MQATEESRVELEEAAANIAAVQNKDGREKIEQYEAKKITLDQGEVLYYRHQWTGQQIKDKMRTYFRNHQNKGKVLEISVLMVAIQRCVFTHSFMRSIMIPCVILVWPSSSSAVHLSELAMGITRSGTYS